MIDRNGWEVALHTHVPSGTKPDLTEAAHWKWSPAQLPFDGIAWLWKTLSGEDPTVACNDLQYCWVEDVDFALRKTFSILPGELSEDDEVQLVLDGVDCYCEVYLNGIHVGRAQNQFREHVFDLDDLHLDRPNELLLYIRSARNVNTVLESAYGQLPAAFDSGRVHARRSQCQTGWDFTPRLSSVAVLTEPRLRVNVPVNIAHPHVYVSHLPAVDPGAVSADTVQLQLELDLTSRRRASGDLVWEVYDCETGELVAESVETLSIKPKTVRTRTTIPVESMKLWWPIGHGAQAMYKAVARLESTDRLGVSYLSEAECLFGVRTVTIDRRKDDMGESFTPVVNGLPIFCRGANWMPVSMLPSLVTEKDYRELLATAIAAGMNCLRVWGGGSYEREIFYDLCDQAGILVWQDFMFAGAAYPVYREFVDEVEAEGVYQVQRLRNHPCLMLWCGNSENEWLHQMGSLRKGNEQRVIGESIWSHLLRETVEDKDPLRIYHQSSPFGKNRSDFNDVLSGDRHSWEVWADWMPIDSYLTDGGRFISEFGMQSLPSRETLDHLAPGVADLYEINLAHHQRMEEGTERLIRYVTAHFDLPDSMEGWIKTSQELQALALSRAVEHWRRKRFHTAGCLVWQFNEPYPAISWSLVDYMRQPKAALIAARRFFAPVLATVEILVGDTPVGAVSPEHWGKKAADKPETVAVEGTNPFQCSPIREVVQCRLWVINSTQFSMSGLLRARFMHAQSEVESLATVQVSVEANGSHMGLTHILDDLLIARLPHLHLEIEFELDEESRERFELLSKGVDSAWNRILDGENAILAPQPDAGLRGITRLVEPKYFGKDHPQPTAPAQAGLAETVTDI